MNAIQYLGVELVEKDNTMQKCYVFANGLARIAIVKDSVSNLGVAAKSARAHFFND